MTASEYSDTGRGIPFAAEDEGDPFALIPAESVEDFEDFDAAYGDWAEATYDPDAEAYYADAFHAQFD